jgi:GT2 family glycosyltransferase
MTFINSAIPLNHSVHSSVSVSEPPNTNNTKEMNLYPRISVIMLNYNGVKWIGGIFFESISRILNSSYPNLEFILADNKSTDNSTTVLEGFLPKFGKNARLLRIQRNLGYSGGNNFAAKFVSKETKYIFFCNNDILLDSEEFFERLIAELELRPSIGAVQPKMVRVDPGSSFNGMVDTVGYLTVFSETVSLDDVKGMRAVPISFPHGAAFLIRREVFEAIGGFNDFYFAYFEDTDLGWRMMLRGYECLCLPTVSAFHFRSSTWRAFRSEDPIQELRQRYLAYRNEMFSMLCNYEASNIFRYFLPKYALSLLAPFAGLLLILMHKDRNKVHSILAYLFACISIFINFRRVYLWRSSIQASRTRKDNALLRNFILDQTPRLPLIVIRILRELGIKLDVSFYRRVDSVRVKCRIE